MAFIGNGAQLTNLDAGDIAAGTLPVARGGTGVTSVGTSGNVLTSNGSAWVSSAPTSPITGARGQVFTSNGTFTIPTGITSVRVTVVGGGGGGGGTPQSCCNNFSGGPGGGGGGAIKYLTGLTPGNTLAVTIGAGGTSGTTNGGAGGSSTVASGTQSISTITGGGGGGGTRLINDYAPPGAGGTASGGDLNMPGGQAIVTSSYQTGGVSILSNAPTAKNTGNGANGLAYGGGATGVAYASSSTRSGGAGAAGVVIFEW